MAMKNESRNGESITYEITEHIGVLRVSPSGWSRELNLVSWNGGAARYDIRDWSQDHDKMSKGLTFSASEARELCRMLASHAQAEDEEWEAPAEKKKKRA